jgi:hypothetical protein
MINSSTTDCQWDTWTCAFATGGGHLDVLKWAQERHCPCMWDENTCVKAAEGGHLDVLKWAREHHCLEMELLCKVAAHCGRSRITPRSRSPDKRLDPYPRISINAWRWGSFQTGLRTKKSTGMAGG